MNEQVEEISKSELLETVRSEYTHLSNLLTQFNQNQMVQPGVEETWSIKDIVGHITAWEQRLIHWVQEALAGDTPQVATSWDQVHQWNEESYQEKREMPLAHILADFHASHQEALTLISSIPEADLINPHRFPWLKGRPLWQMVSGDTREHYKEHREAITQWLREQEKSSQS